MDDDMRILKMGKTKFAINVVTFAPHARTQKTIALSRVGI
jgi:hypothetical protein